MEALLPLVLLAVALYLLVIRPMQMRSRRAADLKAHLKPGVEVITTAGVFGRVERLGTDEQADEVYLEIAPGVVIRMVSAAVGKILTPDEVVPEHTDSTDSAADPAAADAAAESPAGEDPAPPKNP